MIEIREVTTDIERHKVYKLTHDVYLKEGYCKPISNGELQHYPHLNGIKETIVLIAIDNSLIVGTNTITIDGPKGLHVDEDFPLEMKKIRQKCLDNGQLLASSGRIVTDSSYGSQYRLIIKLIKATINIAVKKLNIDFFVIECNPKHEEFYRRIIGFKSLAYGTCRAVGGEPAVLMGIGKNEIKENTHLL